MNRDVIIEIKNLSRIYIMGKIQVPALKGVTLGINKGEFVAIMGKSGSGKSTLLHQLGLLDTPTEGGIVIDGIDVLRLSESAGLLRSAGHCLSQDVALCIASLPVCPADILSVIL